MSFYEDKFLITPEKGGISYEGEVRKFSFSGGGVALLGGRVNFLGEVDTPLHTMHF